MIVMHQGNKFIIFLKLFNDIQIYHSTDVISLKLKHFIFYLNLTNFLAKTNLSLETHALKKKKLKIFFLNKIFGLTLQRIIMS